MADITDLIVMLKQNATETDVADIIERLNPELKPSIIEITRMLNERIFALVSITSGDSNVVESCINQLLSDERVEIAEVNSINTHC